MMHPLMENPLCHVIDRINVWRFRRVVSKALAAGNADMHSAVEQSLGWDVNKRMNVFIEHSKLRYMDQDLRWNSYPNGGERPKTWDDFYY